MTELELYKFCKGKEIDWRGEKLILWIEPWDLNEFAELLGEDYLADGDVEVFLLQGGTIAIELNDICEWYGIEPENILKKCD